MDKCGICLNSADQLFETGKDGVYACFKCQPLVPEVTLDDNNQEEPQDQQVPLKDEDVQEESGLYCEICNKYFSKSMQLQNHMRNHRAERRFVCTYCNKAFSQSNNLRAHLRIHTNERPYKCQECGKAFTQVTNLNNHVRLHTGERPFVCPEPGCDKAYAQVTNLNQHRKRHISGRPMEPNYDCTVCGERFSQRNHMYMHRREAHHIKSPARSAARYSCELCSAALPSEKLLQEHVAQHADAGKDKAQEEHSEFIRREARHIESPVRSAARYSCELCSAALPSEKLLQEHVAQHADAGKDKAQEEHSEFIRREARHIESPVRSAARYSCELCSAALPSEKLLQEHVAQHADAGKDKAQEEHSEFIRREARHIESPVRSAARYSCELCSAALPSEKLLQEHVAQHADAGKDKAQEEHSEFIRREARHIESPARSAARYSCELCSAALPSEKLLQEHVAQHADAGKDKAQEEHKWGVSCVFSSCGVRLSSPRAHTEHLLRAHQLRVLTNSAAHHHPPRRGRPPKFLKDPLDISEQQEYEEVQIVKEEPQYLPKLKVQSLFQ